MPAYRHSCSVYGVLIGLCIGSVLCRTCNSDFEDVPSRTVLSDVVFEGMIRARHETFSADGNYNATMKVKKVLKGYLPKNPDTGRYKTILVGLFGPQNRENCVYDIGIGTYVVFLNGQNASSLDPKVPFYRISAFPQPSSTEVKKVVRKYQCETCAKAPRARVKPREVEVQEGKRINLKCKTSGRPVPNIRWHKDKIQIENKGRIKIKTSKSRKLSRLQIKSASLGDEGIYTCEVTNALGTYYQDIEVTVTAVATPVVPHASPCQEENGLSFCLNGGKCYSVENLGHRFCICPNGFTGYRCRDRDIFDILKEEELKEARRLDRALTITGLVIAAAVLSILVLTAYIISKKKRQNYRKKKEEKFQNAMPKNAANGTYCSMPVEASVSFTDRVFNIAPMMHDQKVQTEEMMNAPYLGIAPVEKAASMSSQRFQASLPQQQSTCPMESQDSPHPNRNRLAAFSATPDMDEFRKQPNAAVVNAVVESDPEQPSKRSSPSQSSKTESTHAHLDHMSKTLYPHDTDLGSKGDLSDLDQRSDYDNQPPSDMDVNLESEADILGLDASGDEVPDHHHHHHHHDDLLSAQSSPAGDTESTETDSEQSSSIGEEQAIFQNLQSNPRVKALQENANLTGQESTDSLFWDDLQHQPSFAMDKQYAFNNPYALDNDIITNQYFKGHGRSSNQSSIKGKDSMDYDMELPYDPDPDATVV